MKTNSSDTWNFISSAPDFYVAMAPLSDLITFIKSVHEFLPYVADQESIRLKAIINKKEAAHDHETVGECEFELEEITRRKKEAWPQIVWGGMLVSIYAAFEHGIGQVLTNWRTAFNSSPAFQRKRGQDFIAAADGYASAQIQIALFPDKTHRRLITDLKELRNSYVHNGNRLYSLNKHIQAKISEGKYIGCSITEEGDELKWIADARTCLFFALKARNIIRHFGNAAFDAYDIRLNKEDKSAHIL